MTLVEKRNRSRTPYIEPDLLEQGISQLSMEIQILNDWLDDLDPAETEPRRSYEDMLRSRHEMLQSLTEQKTRLQATNGDASAPEPPSGQSAS
ncbi:MAG: hypothetical protein Q7W55_10235 [Pseudohongiella sp.]|nr:hypothetical protein [Pseudohongiella sp.]MDO9519767.1 hypothetical protein [Pseudohongiella sp.]MDP2126267.1 hypothetical protein [Pseudohongiella sp.]